MNRIFRVYPCRGKAICKGACDCENLDAVQSSVLLQGTTLSIHEEQARMPQHPRRLRSRRRSRHRRFSRSRKSPQRALIQALEYFLHRVLIFSISFGTPVMGSSSASYSADIYPLYPPSAKSRQTRSKSMGRLLEPKTSRM